jgi:8-oxo-dGTP pyrophosphatase MutT (NUDIX family)
VDEAELRARIGAAPPAAEPSAEALPTGTLPAGTLPLDTLSAGTAPPPAAAARLIAAAVLVPILPAPGAAVLLTKRTAHLRSHAGQVSFPGGRIDPEDATAEAAALREAQEEIGLDPARVELLGRLPDYVTGTGYRVTPVVGLVRPGPALVPSPEEVEAVFELPFAVLLDPAAPTKRRAFTRGYWREFWVWPHPEHDIWGATAGILVELARRLRGEA